MKIFRRRYCATYVGVGVRCPDKPSVLQEKYKARDTTEAKRIAMSLRRKDYRLDRIVVLERRKPFRFRRLTALGFFLLGLAVTSSLWVTRDNKIRVMKHDERQESTTTFTSLGASVTLNNEPSSDCGPTGNWPCGTTP